MTTCTKRYVSGHSGKCRVLSLFLFGKLKNSRSTKDVCLIDKWSWSQCKTWPVSFIKIWSISFDIKADSGVWQHLNTSVCVCQNQPKVGVTSEKHAVHGRDLGSGILCTLGLKKTWFGLIPGHIQEFRLWETFNATEQTDTLKQFSSSQQVNCSLSLEMGGIK